ncbi:J domain-containing protein [Pelagibacterium halotolerans]|uniref:DnaJ-like protein DjlA n=1 Tax=Pelagibacterium halotolerans (strain DSM 22347 / JCM 15775 / CGMCC 1.7692 / B2) TaxID=1082931 RepID=G4RG05_PELHB|nr:DnaJ family molecular chaperone [Pelagibacterium halotolerans]AEQ52019.1 DnaJ-like protein DjlA [Pelagibacterium halotolerans B2]QJR18200.1 DnaJ family molecular chaperone [Pelagibacterium halotolerans]SDZ81711.1 DnaJ like chaperone protein [Pelagibacterium halotolerans]
MSLWQQIAALLGSFSQGTGLAGGIASIFDPDNWMPGGREAAFTMSIIALSAKMAVADGVVSRREVNTFHTLVDIPEGADAHVDRFFALAQQDVAGFDSYARKVRKLFADSPATLEHVLDALFEIATADGFVHGDEMAYLEAVSEIFGFDSVRFEQIASQHVLLPTGHRDPYAVLGLAPDVTDDELRRTYRRLVAEHHPDRMIAKGVPEELMGLASAKMASINTAYRDVTRARGTRPALASTQST